MVISTPQKRKDYFFLIWLLLINACWIFGTKISEILLDFIAEINFTEFQIAESLFSYTIALTIFIWGYVVDRFNQKRKMILFLSGLIWITASFLLILADINFFTLSLIQILWGLSFGANGPLLASYLGDIFKIEKRGRLFSIFILFIYIIKGSNIAINGLLGEFVENWKFPSFLFGLIGLGLIILFILFVKEPQIASKEPEFSEMEDFTYSYKLNIKEVKTIVGQKSNFLFLLQGISGMIGVTTVTKYLSYWFTSNQYDGLNINTGLAILILGSGGALGGLLGIIVAGKWIDSQFKKGKMKKTLYFSICCIFLQVIMYSLLVIVVLYPKDINPYIVEIGAFLTNYPQFYFFILIFNFAVFFGTPIGTTVSVSRTNLNLPEHRGTAGALYDLTDFIGVGLGIMIGSLIMLLFQEYRLTVFFGSIFWIISGIIWIIIIIFIEKDFNNTREILLKRANN